MPQKKNKSNNQNKKKIKNNQNNQRKKKTPNPKTPQKTQHRKNADYGNRYNSNNIILNATTLIREGNFKIFNLI